MKAFLRGFSYAFQGIATYLRSSRNGRVHLFAFLLVVILGWILKIQTLEWVGIFCISALVMSLEAMNTALEALCDKLSPERSEEIKKVKDMAAGAVLIASIFALGIALLIFWGEIQDLGLNHWRTEN